MYSRYHNRSDRSVKLPENYSGFAFSDRSPLKKENDTPSPAYRIDVAKPTPPPEYSTSGMPPPPRTILLPPPKEPVQKEKAAQEPLPNQPSSHEEKEPDPSKQKKDTQPVAFLQPLQGLFGNVGHAFPFSHGIGFDELLIIGLIILLSQNGQDSDLPLWLILLLFSG